MFQSHLSGCTYTSQSSITFQPQQQQQQHHEDNQPIQPVKPKIDDIQYEVPQQKIEEHRVMNKRSNFQFTYDSDNFLLGLIYKYRDDLFTRGNTIKTWEIVLCDFNRRFNSNILQTRTINNRFKNLKKYLETKLISETNTITESTLNENEKLIVNLNDFLNKKRASTAAKKKKTGMQRKSMSDNLQSKELHNMNSYRHNVFHQNENHGSVSHDVLDHALPNPMPLLPLTPSATNTTTNPLNHFQQRSEHILQSDLDDIPKSEEPKSKKRIRGIPGISNASNDLLEQLLISQNECILQLHDLKRDIMDFRYDFEFKFKTLVNVLNNSVDHMEAKVNNLNDMLISRKEVDLKIDKVAKALNLHSGCSNAGSSIQN